MKSEKLQTHNFTYYKNTDEIYIYIYEDDLQLGKLKENYLLLKLYRKLNRTRDLLVSGETL